MVNRVGIFLSDTNASGVLISKARFGKSRVLANTNAELVSGFWEAGDHDFASLFTKIARGLGAPARRANVEVTVALPDPLIVELSLDFAELPASDSETADLVSLTAARAIGKEVNEIHCAYRVNGGNADKHHVLVRILPKQLRDGLVDAAARSGLRMTCLEAASSLFNAQPAVMNKNRVSGIVGNLFVCAGWWALTMRDPSGVAIRSWTDWRAGEADGELAAAVVRRVRSFTYELESPNVQMNVCAPIQSQEKVIEALNVGAAPEKWTYAADPVSDDYEMAQRLVT